MNNVAKFNATRNAIAELKKQLPVLEENLSIKQGKKYIRDICTIEFINSLTINKKAIIEFNSNELFYAQRIWVRKRRINVIPCCLLIQMYKEKLKEVYDPRDERVNIPFDLRGFWTMDKALKFLDELSGMQISWTRNLQRLMNYNYKNPDEVERVLKNISKEIETLEILPPRKGRIEVKTKDAIFTVKTKNMKLDVVPLCKMFAIYYSNVFEEIRHSRRLVNEPIVNCVMNKMIEDFEVLVNKYFMLPMVIR